MEQLAAALGRQGIDTSSLRPLWPATGGGLYGLTTTGQRALRVWHALRDVVTETAHWPVLLGGEGEARSLAQDLAAPPPAGAEESTPAALVRRGLALDPAAWLRERALEQYVYCADIVRQGSDSIEVLAAGLVEAPVWYFWWD
jgi:Domain of unknown function (DUF4253)